MSFAALPESAAWQHREARSGFEVAYFRRIAGGGYHVEGWTTAVEDEKAWIVDYEIEIDDAWATRRARVTGRSAWGSRSTLLGSDGTGTWRIDGEAAPRLDGCLDVDLESSAFTNALPVRRMQLGIGERSAAPAAYIRVENLAVERLEQTYIRVGDEGTRRRFTYAAPAFQFACQLDYDASGLVVGYPGIAVRAG